VTDAAISAALDLPLIFQKFQMDYVLPSLLLAEEKNGSAPSPTGISAGATNIARDARDSAKAARAKSTSRKR
jgi:hypothetical protein